ncbi:MAG: 2-dehydro-3-deoxy-phosphogluconate aldolase [Candidatus Poribacteria bacterium]|nr:MAG: 2-dehydro-3-deoxy-phosphogluconate aldolase [Candidatus Poribacteria bacterium]
MSSYRPDRGRTLESLRRAGITVVIGADHVRTAGDLIATVEAIAQFGYVPEITFRISAELLREAMGELRRRDLCLGIGSVTTPGELEEAIALGADLIVGPARFTTAAEVRMAIARAQARGVVVAPAAFTPTEFSELLALNADVIKLFPARVLGPEGVADLLAPFVRPETEGLLIMPTGGIGPENAPEYVQAVRRRKMVPVLGMSAPLNLVREKQAPGDRSVIEESLSRFREAYRQAMEQAGAV